MAPAGVRSFDGIITLTRLLNKRYRPVETQRKTQGILKSMLPPGLPGAFKVRTAVRRNRTAHTPRDMSNLIRAVTRH